MRRPILLLCLFTRLSREQPTVQRYFEARRARQSSAPATAYFYSRLTDGRTHLGTLQNPHAREKRGEVQTATSLEADNFMDVSTSSSKAMDNNDTSSDAPSLLVTTRYTLWPQRASRAASGAVMKSHGSVFRIDDEDLRTDFKNSYDFWPFFYQSLYEYEPLKFVGAEKAIDKRFAIPTNEKIIPVYENVNETTDNNVSGTKSTNSGLDYKHPVAVTNKNPTNYDKQSFFSNGLNDYFDNTAEDDSTTLQKLSRGKEINDEMSFQDIEDSERLKRLEKNSPNDNREQNTNTVVTHDGQDTLHESVHNKGRNSYRESASSNNEDDNKHSYSGDYEYEGDNYRGFEDIVDSFANKFGLEEHDREAKFAKKNNADKGAKKKGFRTVYHKDEYQEHHDFFDNTDDNENMEEKGASKIHIGGSEGILRSLTGAVKGNDKSKLKNVENIERNQYERNQNDKEGYTDADQELEQYRDVAKNTALSSNAQYVDRYVV